MTDAFKVGFGPFTAPSKGVVVVFCDEGLKFGPGHPPNPGGGGGRPGRAGR